MQYLNQSPTAWHAVAVAAEQLKECGFTELLEGDSWSLVPGKSYFVIHNGSSLCAFITPSQKPAEAHVVASHTDSPGFKLKPNAEYRKENMVMLGVEMYGAPLITSWYNRDLGIAGRVVYLDANNKVKETLVRLDKSPVVIPQLAIHLDRQVNENGLMVNKQEQLAALAALNLPKDQSFLDQLLQEQFKYKQLLSSDLYLFPLEPASLVGWNQQMMASYRIDSLNSVHAALEALCTSESSKETLKMMIIWDNEEIGSGTAQGAASPFFSQVLERITLGFDLSREDYFRLISRSLCLSVDLAHAMHPNYGDKHEPRHPVLMGQGLAVKFNAQQRYASDARSAAKVMEICQKENIPVQPFVTRGDIPCGTTIGPIHAQNTGMMTVDVGCAQLSMHSCRELASCQDYLEMLKLLKAFLN